jgi:hypothetical protein
MQHLDEGAAQQRRQPGKFDAAQIDRAAALADQRETGPK